MAVGEGMLVTGLVRIAFHGDDGRVVPVADTEESLVTDPTATFDKGGLGDATFDSSGVLGIMCGPEGEEPETEKFGRHRESKSCIATLEVKL